MSRSGGAPGALRERAIELREQAVGQLSALAGSRSACALARNGVSFPAYKLHEGRWAAASDAIRQLARPGADEDEVVAALVERWAHEVAVRASASRDWQAYAAGGLDVAVELSRETLGGVR